MMRIISIVAIVLSLVLVIGTVLIIHDVSCSRSAASRELFSSDYSSDDSGFASDSMFDMYEQDAADSTRSGAIFVLLIMAVLDTAFVLSLVRIKTKTMKILSIIGMSLGGILTLAAIAPLSSPSGCSFDEAGVLFTLFGIISLAFFVIGTIHAFRTKS